jgi:hypothetical protein
MIGCKIDGVERLIADFKGYKINAEKAVQRAIDQTGLAIQKDAKQRLKGMFGSAKHWITGNLAASIYNRKTGNKLERVVGTHVEYAPYIEFGIGDFVEIPEGTENVARQYKGKKKVKGFKGDSFLNWAAINQQPKLIERITKEMNAIK